MVKVTDDEVPVLGVLPVPVHPMQTYWVPSDPDTGDAICSVRLVPLLNQLVDGEGEPCADIAEK